MKLNIKNSFIILSLTAVIAGCAQTSNNSDQALSAEKITYKHMLNFNVENINKVKNGMTIDEVKLIMKDYNSEVRDGPLNNPWKIESSGNTEIFHYLTKSHPPFTPILEYQSEPVIFVDGKVQSIGRAYLKSARRASSESFDSPGGDSVEERLMKLKSLYEGGLIDQDLYNEQKKRILDSI